MSVNHLFQDIDNPKNPGSIFHNYGQCKPCNKFISGKLNSCKHENKCKFCHNQVHEKPKHCGQRRRHAIQKKLLIQQQLNYPNYIIDSINMVYNQIQNEYNKIKIILYTSHDSDERINKNQYIATEIKNIGIYALSKRPKLERSQNSTIDITKIITVSDLDNKIKWLEGTIQLTIQKIYDDNPNELMKENIESFVYKSIDMIKILSKNIIDYPKNYKCPELYNYYSLMYETILDKVPHNSLELILSNIKILLNQPHVYQDISNIERLFHRFSVSIYDDIEFKKIIINNHNFSDLIKSLDNYLELILDNLFDSIDKIFE